MRRGDYLEEWRGHGLTTKDYYQSALSLIRSLDKPNLIVVFSPQEPKDGI